MKLRGEDEGIQPSGIPEDPPCGKRPSVNCSPYSSPHFEHSAFCRTLDQFTHGTLHDFDSTCLPPSARQDWTIAKFSRK